LATYPPAAFVTEDQTRKWGAVTFGDRVRSHLITILDVLSRYVWACGIVKTVSRGEVKNLVLAWESGNTLPNSRSEAQIGDGVAGIPAIRLIT
jgi:hypothetical protein